MRRLWISSLVLVASLLWAPMGLLGQQSLRLCLGCGQRLSECRCSRGNNNYGRPDDGDCASARRYLLAKVQRGELFAYSAKDIREMGCSRAETVASIHGWKSSDERRREAESRQRQAEWEAQQRQQQNLWEAQRRQQQAEWDRQAAEWEAERRQEQAQEEAKKRQEQAAIQSWKAAQQQLEKAQADLRAAKSNPDFEADPAKVKTQIEKLQNQINDFQQQQLSASIAGQFEAANEIWKTMNEAKEAVNLLEDLLHAGDPVFVFQSGTQKQVMPITGEPNPGSVSTEYLEQAERSAKEVGVISKNIVGPAKQRIYRIGEQSNAMIKDGRTWEEPISSGSGGSFAGASGPRWTPPPRTGSSSESLRGQPPRPVTPRVPRYVNPLGDFREWTADPAAPLVNPPDGGLADLLSACDAAAPGGTNAPAAPKLPTSAAPPPSTGGSPPGDWSAGLRELIEAFDQ